jgi:hypothetical protein
MAINKVRLPVIGTDVGGHSKFAGFVPVLNPSGKLDASMIPGNNNTYIQTKSITIERPTNNEKIIFFQTKGPITITSIESIVLGPSNASVNWSLRFDEFNYLVGTEVVVGGIFSTEDITINVVPTFSNPNIPENVTLWLTTTAVANNPAQLHITIQYQ